MRVPLHLIDKGCYEPQVAWGFSLIVTATLMHGRVSNKCPRQDTGKQQWSLSAADYDQGDEPLQLDSTDKQQ